MNSRIFFVLILIIGGLAVFGSVGSGQAPASGTMAEVAGESTGYEATTKEMGVVEVEVEPIALVAGSPSVFRLSLNNHSVDLDYDFREIVSLEDDRGNVYKASSWTGGEGGHHVRGDVTFESLDKRAGSVSLVVDGVDNSTASFEWKLE